MQGRISYILLILFIIAAGCANVVTPTGGEKDITPPIAVSYSPDTNTVFFDATEIKITFNEFIQLSDAFNQVLISPPLEQTPDYKVKGKTLTISLYDTLKANTTYTINFGQSIKDITESNVLDNFTYVFSTGEQLDSLQVSGKVIDMLTGKPIEKAYALLYYEPTDSSFTTSTPYYFARTNKEGLFTIKNIREGNYQLYALEDMNFNYFYDLPNERIAFQDSGFYINGNIPSQQLKMFSEDRLPQSLQDIRSPRYGMTRMVFAKNAADVQITYLGGDEKTTYIARNIAGDTLTFWTSNYAIDSHHVSIAFDTTLLDRTIALKTFPVDSDFTKQHNAFTTNAVAINKGADARADWDPEHNVTLKFFNPVMQISDSILVYSDSALLGKATITIDSLDARSIYVSYPFTTDKSYDLKIPAGFTTDIFGLKNTVDTIKLKTRKSDAYGTLALTLTNLSNTQVIVELIKYDGSPVQTWRLPVEQFNEVTKSTTINKKYLIPGVYRLRLTKDINGDGKWSTGDLTNGMQPEPILYFNPDQNIRANWDNEIEWEIK
jgi:uncharacterized protein (DUF2141 family)